MEKPTNRGCNTVLMDITKRWAALPMLGRTVSRIDPQAKSVFLENGEAVAYDKLMVAAGSRPFVPPMEGLDKVENCFSFMSLGDAKALANALTASSRVLIIGCRSYWIEMRRGHSKQSKKYYRSGPCRPYFTQHLR